MKKFLFFLKYIKYLLSAKTVHSIHSPFVFELCNEVLHKKGSYYVFDRIEHLRKKLLLSNKEIFVADLGTGESGKKTIAEIVECSAKNEKCCRLLFRLVNYFQPEIILELGTSLGTSACYLASANSKTKVITIEGCPNLASEARRNFESLGLNNVESVIGNFDSVLSDILCQLPTAYCLLVFFDGNHKREPTLSYFSQCLAYTKNDSVFVFDDIHWSDEMGEAWEEIKKHPQVTVTIDLFFLGLVFFRKEQAKENFIVRF